MPYSLSFVPLQHADRAELSTVLTSDTMLAYMDIPNWKLQAEVAELVQASTVGQASLHLIQRNGFVVGIAGLSHICVKHRFAYITCGILPHFQRSGIAFQALRRVESMAFDGLGLHRIEAQVHEDNLASIAFFRKAGYKEEGRMRGNFFAAGSFSDSILFGKLSHD